jgi:hypothetical protein
MKAIRIFGLAAASAAVALLPSTLPASAQPIAGSYYAGEITGCDDPPCGTVDFRVSGDGLLVKRFKAYDVDGVDCRFWGPQPYPGDLAIEEDNSFGPGWLGMFEVSGSFPSEGSAEGTLRLAPHPPGEPPPCDTGVLDWTATAGYEPVGGIAVLPDVTGSSAPNYIPLAGLAAAALVALTAGGWHARRRFSQELIRLRRRLR